MGFPMTDLDQLAAIQAQHPHVDVLVEHAKARAKYPAGFTPGWFALCWIPRSRWRPRHRRIAERRAGPRDQVWAIATAVMSPADWLTWAATTLPGVDVPAWADAPIDLRQAYARHRLAGSTGQAGAGQPSAARSVDATSMVEATKAYPPPL